MSDRLVDTRSGLIRRLFRYDHPPELPAALVSFTSEVSDTRQFGPWQADRVALGAAFYDEAHARMAAIGEAVERYCGNMVPPGLRRASYAQLQQEGAPALDPETLILYSAHQYAQRGFPFVPFTRDLSVRWVEGRRLDTGDSALVPASLAYVNFLTGTYHNEPPTHFVMYSGIACGPTRAAAERAALEEVIERDATMIWWMSGSPATGLRLASAPALERALFARAPRAISYQLIAVPSCFGVPVVGALIHDADLQVMALGIACRPDPQQAALKALAEAVHLRIFAQGLLDPGGHVWQGIQAGLLDSRSYKPFRADRTYRDAFRADYRDVIDLGSQAQYYLDPRTHAELRRITHPPHTMDIASPSANDDPRRHYLNLLARHGFTPYSVDLTTPDVRACGLHVVRVIVPGLYPNAPAAFPFLGGQRLYHEPYEQGWLPAPLREDQLVYTPLPHT